MLITITCLTIQFKVEFDAASFIDRTIYSKRADDPMLGKYLGSLGWLEKLIQHDDILLPMSKLVNTVLS